MTEWSAIWATLLVSSPALAATAVLLGRLAPKQAAAWGVGASAVSVGAAAILLGQRSIGVSTIWAGSSALPLELSWRLEMATLALAILVAGIGALVLQYAGSYFASARRADHRPARRLRDGHAGAGAGRQSAACSTSSGS